MNWLVPESNIDEGLRALPRASAPPEPGILEGEFWRQVGSNTGAAFQATVAAGNSNSRTTLFGQAYEPLVQELNKDRPFYDRLDNPYVPVSGLEQGLSTEELEARVWTALEQARTKDPGRYANLPKNAAEFNERIHQQARDRLDEAAAVYGQSRPLAANIGTFLGGAGGMMEDPVNILSLGLGGSGAASYLRLFLQEAGINAGATALELPAVAKWRAELGRSMTGGEVAEDLATAAVGGGAIAVAGRAFHRNLLKPGVEAIRRLGEDAPPAVRAAANVVEDEEQRAAENPLSDSAEGREAHRLNLVRAAAAIDAGQPAALPEAADLISRAADPAVDARSREGTAVEAFKPSELETDANMMQYKRGGDEAGVTERLQGVKEWNPAFAGQILVFETRDGRRVVADGHQRLGLAKRLEGEGQDVTLYGVTLREADGWTAQKARMLAALKNIAEGSGDSLDAAAVLREAPEGVTQLPPRSGLVRRARELAALSSDAWGMAWNGVASERDAALVGRLVPDQKLHASILDYVTKAEPETAEEAELIVRQALAAGAREEVQTDMFGGMLKQDLILPERVRILKASLTQLRKDRGLFKTLTSREDAIAAEGNRLASDANARALERAGRLFETIKALAERKGPISDALQTAAVQAKETGNRRNAIRAFVADVRGRVERNELDGDTVGRPIGDVEPAPARALGTPPANAAERGSALSAKEFADPKAKPEGFEKQRQDLARELGGEAMHAPKPEGEAAAASPFGNEAAQQLSLFDAFDPKERTPAPQGLAGEDGTLSIGELRAQLENEAKAVERLRRCAEGEA